MKYVNYIIITLICMLGLQACSKGSQSSNNHTITVTRQAFSKTLFFSGTVQPLKTLVIPSPAAGVVVEMPFQYGETIKAGQLLFMLSSEKFLTDYKSSLMQYIKAKSDFNNSQTQLTEAEFLHKNQLISDDDFKMKQSNYYAAQLALLQAKDSLENLLHQLNVKNVDLYKLTISDIDKITQAMNLQISAAKNLNVLAPAEGIVLSPSKNEDENKKITIGDVVKEGDVLAVIGDMSGLSVRIKVNELSINQLKVKQKVKITGIAFPDDILNGEVTRVDRQGDSSGGGLPSFLVEVAVPKLTPAQQKDIHVGMSAKVEIKLEEDPQFTIPLSAVVEKNGESYVKLYDKKSGQNKEVAVVTGKTTIDSVTIQAGLKEGDQIVIPN